MARGIQTTERAQELVAIRRATGRLGGRPKGVLNAATIQKIKDKRSMEAAIQKRAGRIVDNLLRGSDELDTQASKELLERGFGKVVQPIDNTIKIFSLTGLAKEQDMLDGNKDLRILDAPPPTIEP